MIDDQPDDGMRDALRSYHAPAAVPAEAMWTAIERQRCAASDCAPSSRFPIS